LLAPVGADTCTSRRYVGDTLVLETEWVQGQAAVKVIDFMPPRGHAPDIIRIVEGISGSVAMASEWRVRFDYGSIIPWVRRIDGDLSAVGGPDSVWLRSPVRHTAADHVHRAEFTVREGDRVPFVCTWHPSHLGRPAPVDAEQALADTEGFWVDWMAHCNYDGEWRDAVVRSLLTLKSLIYTPTGGVVAAVTTSLPEALGGPRNWDYRYCWLRDATMTLQALLYSGHDDEAASWRDWLLRAVAGEAGDLRIMYGVAGERRLQESELTWLPGYAGSRPVRVGNAASEQFQLDVYGEVLDALHLDRAAGMAADGDAWALQRGLLDELERRWAEPDQGLWEMRGDPQHFVHSKVMAWVGFDRAVRAVTDFGFDGPVERWRALRDQIHAEVCAKGFDSDRNTFTQAYGTSALDASLLLIPQVGFLPEGDPRVVGTVDAINRELTEDGLVKRYDTAGGGDGLAGGEAAFLACSFWLADDLHLIGRQDEAREILERLLALRNDVGLLSEEYDAGAGRQLGNTPQAFSHVPLVNTARALSRKGASSGRVSRRNPRQRPGGGSR
jgi:GH15 family glucan-1,4-alpha-glucosidase